MIRTVLVYPDKRLRNVAEAVGDFDDDFKRLVNDLIETMEAYKAHGLAATQLGVDQRVFVINTSGTPLVFVNPRIVETSGVEKMREGCLSFPGVYEIIERPAKVTITAFDREGVEFTVTADELDATAILHENDHLNGVLFIDHMSPFKRRYALKALKKSKKKFGR